MKILFTYILLFFILGTQAQLLTAPNKMIAGRETGIWSQFEFCDSLDFEGTHHLLWFQHNPEIVLAEGNYLNGNKEGFWKRYWVEKVRENNRDILQRRNLKSMTEYKHDVEAGLFIDYYRSGRIRIIGHYDTFLLTKIDTFQIRFCNGASQRHNYEDGCPKQKSG